MKKKIVIEDVQNGFVVEKRHFSNETYVFKTLKELLDFIATEYCAFDEEEEAECQ